WLTTSRRVTTSPGTRTAPRCRGRSRRRSPPTPRRVAGRSRRRRTTRSTWSRATSPARRPCTSPAPSTRP
ncbi:MAG: hypothetical protein AVDCRST_MAG35-521, partial [uncultured Quadrisphaera sp.]